MADLLINDACERYLSACDGVIRETTLRRYRQIAEGDLMRVLGRRRLSQVNQAQADRLTAAMRKRGLSPSSVNQTRAVLANVYRHARRHEGYDGPDASILVERASQTRSGAIEVYTIPEILRLVDAASSLQDRGIFLTAALAGLRLSEVRALRWRDVDLERSLIRVSAGYTDQGGFAAPKSGRVRSTPMSSHVSDELTTLRIAHPQRGDDDLVFCTPGGNVLNGDAIYRRFRSACRRAKLRPLRFHDLRHTFGTTAVRVYPLSDVMAFLGHSKIETTMIYVHHVPRADDAAKLDALIAREAA